MLHVSVRRFEDGTVHLYVGCDGDSWGTNPYVSRYYREPVDLGDAIDDAARMMSAWGALGQWGFVDAGDRLRQLDRF